MQIIQPIRMEEAAGSTLRLMESVSKDRGAIPNMIKSIAHSPQTLEGYLQFRRALAGGKIEPEVRERIALAVAQANHCDYSLAEHTALASRLGLTFEEIMASREGRAGDRRTSAALQFARNLVMRNGDCSTVEVREAGYRDAEIVEMVALVALYVFENYFNSVAQTQLDFPSVGMKTRAA
jgi:AhpD family alkylhydroperoxidase